MTTIDPKAGHGLSAIGFPRVTTAWEAGEIIKSISCDFPCVLALDDFQFILHKLPRTVATSLLSYAGANLHFVIATQSTRPYPRSFFEQLGVYYIRTDDLRMHPKDIHQYFRLCGMAISKTDAQELYKYTEGWIAAIYLTMLQIQRGEGFSPGQGIIKLMESIVWKSISGTQKRILLYFALFPFVTIEQMQYLVRWKTAFPAGEGDFLEILEQTPFIRYEKDKKRYAAHAILREMLIRRLDAADRQIKIHCYIRAGKWHSKVGEIEQALYCFFKAEDYASFLSLPLTKMTLARVGGKPFTQIAAKLMEKCPEEIKSQYPISLLRIAYAYIGANQMDPADKLMKEIRAFIEDTEDENERRALEGEWTLVSAFREFPDMAKMELLLTQAADKIGGICRTLAPDEPFFFGLPLMIFLLKQPGGMAEELGVLEKIVGHIARLTGKSSGADVLYRAEFAFYRGELDEAEALCHKAYYLADEACQWSVRMGAVNQLALIDFKRGSGKDLAFYLNSLEEAVGDDALSPLVSQMLQGYYYFWRGLSQLIPEWIVDGKVSLTDAPIWVKIYLRYSHLVVLLQKEHYARFLGAAEAALMECRKTGFLMVQIYIRLLLAVCHYQLGREEEAFAHAQTALADAFADRLFLPFIEYRHIPGDFMERAFSSFGEKMPEEVTATGQILFDNLWILIRHASEKKTLSYCLTEREMEVATLAAKGMSNKEIASHLFISQSTVKFHMRTVFSKLDIKSRGKIPTILSD